MSHRVLPCLRARARGAIIWNFQFSIIWHFVCGILHLTLLPFCGQGSSDQGDVRHRFVRFITADSTVAKRRHTFLAASLASCLAFVFASIMPVSSCISKGTHAPLLRKT